MTIYAPGTLETDTKKIIMSLQQLAQKLAAAGTVTSVGLANTYGLVVSGSPIIASGNISAGVGLTPITNSLSGDVSLNNTSNYFDGPSIAQGTSGTWFVSGTVTVTDTSNARVNAKLWDGTTVIASTQIFVTAGFTTTMSLSGYIASPAANLRISCRDNTNTTGKIQFNQSGESKDSTISAIRIA